jgi:hypothetical protein
MSVSNRAAAEAAATDAAAELCASRCHCTQHQRLNCSGQLPLSMGVSV